MKRSEEASIAMLGAPLELSVHARESTLYLGLSGDFDRAGVGPVERALERISPGETRSVVVDLRRLAFLDLAGLRTILRANDRSVAERFELVVVRPRGSANRIFTLTRAGAELTMVDQPPAAPARETRERRFSAAAPHG